MTQQSLTQITSKDLSKINNYLELIQEDLRTFHTDDEIQEIIKIIREQLFQKIELNVTVSNKFDIDEIIENNRSDNKALLHGNDKNEVLFNLSKPTLSWFDRARRTIKIPEKPSDEDQSNETMSSSEAETEPLTLQEKIEAIDQSTFEYILPVAILFAFLAVIPTYFTQSLSIPVLGVYIFSTVFIAKFPTRDWVRSLFIIHLGLSFSVGNSIYWNDDFFLAYFQFIIPIFSIVITNNFLKSNTIITDYLTQSGFMKIIYTILFGFLHYGLFMGIYLIQYTFYDISGNSFVSLLFITILIYSVIYYFSHKYLIDWNLKLIKTIENPNTGANIKTELDKTNKTTRRSSTENEEKSQPLNDKTSPREVSSQMHEQLAYNKESSPIQSISAYFGRSSSNERLKLTINTNKVERQLHFNLFTPVRIVLLLLSLPFFGVTFFFYTLTDKWALRYYITTFDLDGIYRGSSDYIWFRRDVILSSFTIGMILLSFIAVLIMFEFVSWFFKYKSRKVISHLMLRQGVITIDTLSMTPPNISPESYYNQLGKLTMQNIIAITHLEGSK